MAKYTKLVSDYKSDGLLEMNKILYFLLIVFLGAATAIALWTFILTFKIGAEIYKLNSYIAWSLLGNTIVFIGSILLIKYYYSRSYRLTFFTGIVAILATFGYASAETTSN